MKKIEFIRDLQRSFPHSESGDRVKIANQVFDKYGQSIEVDHEENPFNIDNSHVSFFKSETEVFGIRWDFDKGFVIV